MSDTPLDFTFLFPVWCISQIRSSFRRMIFDRAKGSSLERRWRSCSTFWRSAPGISASRSSGVRGGTNSARWELDTIDDFEGTTKGGPSHLRYEIPWNVRAAAVFKVRILPDIALTGELGMGWGLIRENKTSAVSTMYDYEGWVPGIAAGTGLEWRLSRRLDLVARFAYVGYRAFTYASHFPDGEIWETISDQPSCLSGRIGLLFRIGER